MDLLLLEKQLKKRLEFPYSWGKKQSDEDDKKMRQKDAEAREEYEKQKKEAEKKSIEAGKNTAKGRGHRKDTAFLAASCHKGTRSHFFGGKGFWS